jgi:hypothetical protein
MQQLHSRVSSIRYMDWALVIGPKHQGNSRRVGWEAVAIGQSEQSSREVGPVVYRCIRWFTDNAGDE